MENYNGLFTQSLQIIIESDNHRDCLDFKKRLKKAIDPWFFQLEFIHEHKSANKGEKFRREIQVSQTAYATDIITFKQMIDRLIWHYNLRFNVNIFIFNGEVIPKDSRRNLLR